MNFVEATRIPRVYQIVREDTFADGPGLVRSAGIYKTLGDAKRALKVNHNYRRGSWKVLAYPLGEPTTALLHDTGL